MQRLQQALGYAFRDPSHLRLALTHPSTKLPDNQRLEFLGDAVLEFCVSDMLYQKYPDLHEGELTARRAALVCEPPVIADTPLELPLTAPQPAKPGMYKGV